MRSSPPVSRRLVSSSEKFLVNGSALLPSELSCLSSGLKALARAGATLPDVGMELADEKGRVLADAELAWVNEKLALLRPDQEDLVDAWKAAGWTVELLDDVLVSIQGDPWEESVAARLGLTLQMNKE